MVSKLATARTRLDEQARKYSRDQLMSVNAVSSKTSLLYLRSALVSPQYPGMEWWGYLYWCHSGGNRGQRVATVVPPQSASFSPHPTFEFARKYGVATSAIKYIDPHALISVVSRESCFCRIRRTLKIQVFPKIREFLSPSRAFFPYTLRPRGFLLPKHWLNKILPDDVH